MSMYRIGYGSENSYYVGILANGTLHNPHRFPDDLVRAVVLAADAYCRSISRGNVEKRKCWDDMQAAMRAINGYRK